MSDHFLPLTRVRLEGAGVWTGVSGWKGLVLVRGSRDRLEDGRSRWAVALVVVLKDRLLGAKILLSIIH